MATIFLIDDSPLHLMTFARTLEERGYEIRRFSRAAEALRALDDNIPDLVVSDIQMPEMDGVELCQEIRKRIPKEILPILLVSTLDSMEHMVRGYEAGADDYLVKPVRSQEFHAKVSLLLRQRRAIQASRPVSGAYDTSAGPRRLIDRYEALDVLGEGAYGIVYRARRLGCEDIIALKVLSQAKLSERSIARFLRETEVLKTLGAVENISKIVDVGFDGEHYFYAMELISGCSIRDLLKEKGALPQYAGLRVALDIATTLKALAACEIVHRDIKPANIILGEDGRPTLIDFGLARITESSTATVTGRHELPGTPAYIPPEAIRGDKLDVRGDIYSLGVTTFELLTSRLPYEGADGLFMLVHVAEGRAPNMEPLLEARLHPGFAGIIERMIANDPDERYQTPHELIADLSQYI